MHVFGVGNALKYSVGWVRRMDAGGRAPHGAVAENGVKPNTLYFNVTMMPMLASHWHQHESRGKAPFDPTYGCVLRNLR